ncbi:MAG: hypothetical protein M1834_002732 [Cirrosporium novae-zelandiae]|nr:MAG: hypothetical protein M1834_002732 [Cirrosporium novae-zelandiae]
MVIDADSEDELRHRTPPLTQIKVNYALEESPQPSLASSSFESSSESDSTSDPSSRMDRKKKRKKTKADRRKTRPSQGDAVLLYQLAPDHPEVAREAGIRFIGPDSDSESRNCGEDEDMTDRDAPQIDEKASQKTATDALQLLIDNGNNTNSPDEEQKPVSLPIHPHHEGLGNSRKESSDAAWAGSKPSQGQLSPRSSRKPSRIHTDSGSQMRESPEATSPLQSFAITHGSPMDTLPAMQMSPSSNGPSSPEGTQKLPSIHTQLGKQFDAAKEHGPLMHTSRSSFQAMGPLSGHSAPFDNKALLPQRSGSITFPSQHLGTMSPPTSSTMVNFPSFQHDRRMSTSSVHRGMSVVSSSTSTSPSNPQYTPSQSTESPNSNPTPSDQMANGDSERSSFINGTPQLNGPLTSSGFKCTYPGCNALPFQTQYLLKHVRVNHMDKDKDDPALRDVLSRRPEGGPRGRRRRLTGN